MSPDEQMTDVEFEQHISEQRKIKMGLKIADAMMALKKVSDTLQEIAMMDVNHSHYPWIYRTFNAFEEVFVSSYDEFGPEQVSVSNSYGFDSPEDLVRLLHEKLG